ncbi:MAG: hypothetical protein A2145_06815 [candidate division Zixibacteria bacterium RBG_16_40_9]|nr:MAG: hypothetical protein A2145_06815 [candidate division Zixibacteria bacterium RBG_16_40_9]
MLVEFSVIPMGNESLSKPVSQIIDIIDKSGLSYQTTAMGTLIEGEWDKVFGVLKRCHNLLREKYHRVFTTIRIDDRRGAKNRIKGKVDEVEQILKRKIRR